MLETIKPWLYGAAIIFLVGIGWESRSWYDTARTTNAIVKQDKAVESANSKTLTATTSAATHIRAATAAVNTLQDTIRSTPLTPTQPGGNHDAPHHSTAAPSVCASPFSDPAFRLLYNAGSRATAPAKTSHLPPAS